MPNPVTKGPSSIIRTVVTLIILILSTYIPPVGLVGLIAIWFWTLWPKWLKVLITVPFALFYALLLFENIALLLLV
ncbi:MAG: hypothetical protein M1289_01985 [Patescibacteria group bacterium]|nr:hypothetical protein [Patescibacteria group bacterium]